MNKTYRLIVRPTQVLDRLTLADSALVGTYQVVLMGVEDHAEGNLADAVLGSFHDTYGVDNVDDLDLFVFNERGQAVSVEMDSVAPDDVEVDIPEHLGDATNDPEMRA